MLISNPEIARLHSGKLSVSHEPKEPGAPVAVDLCSLTFDPLS